MWYREASSEEDLVMRAENETQLISQTAFHPTFIFIATWDHVSFFGDAAGNLVSTVASTAFLFYPCVPLFSEMGNYGEPVKPEQKSGLWF